MGAWGRLRIRLTMGRIGRQLLAACALSLALVAAVLGFGALAVSQLDSTPPPAGSAASSRSGVFTLATTATTRFAAPRRPAHKTSVTMARVAFRRVSVTPRPPATPSHVRPRAAKPAKQRARRRPARKPAGLQPVAGVASVTPTPASTHTDKTARLTRGRSGKPKTTPPAQVPAVSSPAHGGMKPYPRQRPKPMPMRATRARSPRRRRPPDMGHGHGQVGHGPPARGN